MAALIPETTYGNVVEAQFREAAARRGLRVVAIERYPAGPAAGRGAAAGARHRRRRAQADALFVPENGDGLPAVAQALQAAGSTRSG